MNHNNLTVEVFKGKEASVNSYLFSNGSSLLVMDVLRSTQDAMQLADFIKKKQLPLKTILITHGHPDHYIGMNHLKKVILNIDSSDKSGIQELPSFFCPRGQQ